MTLLQRNGKTQANNFSQRNTEPKQAETEFAIPLSIMKSKPLKSDKDRRAAAEREKMQHNYNYLDNNEENEATEDLMYLSPITMQKQKESEPKQLSQKKKQDETHQ